MRFFVTDIIGKIQTGYLLSQMLDISVIMISYTKTIYLQPRLGLQETFRNILYQRGSGDLPPEAEAFFFVNLDFQRRTFVTFYP